MYITNSYVATLGVSIYVGVKLCKIKNTFLKPQEEEEKAVHNQEWYSSIY